MGFKKPIPNTFNPNHASFNLYFQSQLVAFAIEEVFSRSNMTEEKSHRLMVPQFKECFIPRMFREIRHVVTPAIFTYPK
jgi:hypothetical protein